MLVCAMCAAMAMVLTPAIGQPIPDAEAGLEQWTTTLLYGDVGGTQLTADEGNGDGESLRIDYRFRGAGTNHVVYVRDVDLDLSGAEGIRFDVKGTGASVMIFLFVWDSAGHFNNYGPHGSERGFRTGYGDWTTLQMSIDKSRPVHDGQVDWSDIKRIGFMLNQSTPAEGSVWIDNIEVIPGEARVAVRPSVFSPNGDGVYDEVTVEARMGDAQRVSLTVENAAGEQVAALTDGTPPRRRGFEVTWDGQAGGRALPDGQYTIRARYSEGSDADLSAKVAIDTSHKWPPIQYTNKPVFPIGLWFEGSPRLSESPDQPEEAKKYYDRCFADMAQHDFNAVAVPNCPSTLWETLLQSAQEKGINVCLEVGPLVGLVSRTDGPSEAEAHQTAKGVVEKLGQYDSLMRYQIRDEPPSPMVPNWILVQRILAALDPARPAFSCFCHPDSLKAVSRQTPLSEAVFDIYPHRQGMPPQTMGGFESALKTFTEASGGNDMWVVLQAFAVPSPNSWRYPTAEELRCATYLSLAAGAKGIFYFIYQYMPEYLWGLVEPDGTPRPQWKDVSQLAGELRALSPLLLTLTPAEPTGAVPGDARLGWFETPEGKPVMIVTNPDPGKALQAEIAVAGGFRWRDALTDETFSTRKGTVNVSLPPGHGRVLVAE